MIMKITVWIFLTGLSPKQLAFASNRLFEIGSDLGGWIKQQSAGKPI